MDIKHLRYFINIVEEGGYSKAARKLFVSQPNLSKSIKNLEEELGTQLFFMKGNNTYLTEAGKKMYRLANNLVEQYDNIFIEMKNMTNMTTGTIRIGIPPIIGTCVLPNLISNFSIKYPGIKIEINQKGSRLVQEMVNDDCLDVGFTILPVITNAFHIVPIVKDRNVLILHEDHPLANKEKVDYGELKNERFILLDDEYTLYRNIIAGCNESHFEPRIILKVSYWDLAVQLVKANLGISVIPRPILEMYPEPRIKLVNINHRSGEWNVVMIYKKDKYRSLALRKFIRFVEEYS